MEFSRQEYWNEKKKKNTGMDSHSLLLGIFPTQGSNPGLLHSKQILYHLSHQGSPFKCISVSSWFVLRNFLLSQDHQDILLYHLLKSFPDFFFLCIFIVWIIRKQDDIMHSVLQPVVLSFSNRFWTSFHMNKHVSTVVDGVSQETDPETEICVHEVY